MKAKVLKIIAVAAVLGATPCVTFAAHIKETHEGTAGKRVYILEDIHGDAAVQKEHLKTLAGLVSGESLRLVVTEGSAGYLSSFPLLQLPASSSARLAAAQALLGENEINAAHLVQALVGKSLTVAGVENRREYERHLAIAEKIAKDAAAVAEEWKKASAYLSAVETQEWVRVFSLRVTRATAESWKKVSLAERLETVLARVPETSGVHKELLRGQALAVEAFYAAAFHRDAHLAENTLIRMDLEQEKTCALIVGGFHTEGITKILRENGVSFTVISPE